MGHLFSAILDKPEFFSRQNLYQKNACNSMLCLTFENHSNVPGRKSYRCIYRVRIPIAPSYGLSTFDNKKYLLVAGIDTGGGVV